MARKAKPPPSTLVFSAAEWAPLTEAFARAEGALGSSYLAEGNLVEHFRSGRLPTARYRGRAFVCVEPTFWKSLRAEEDDRQTGHPSILVSGLPDELTSAAGFFVARAALGKLYSTDPTPSGALPEASDPQRRRGRIVVHDWHTICGEIARRCLDSLVASRSPKMKASSLTTCLYGAKSNSAASPRPAQCVRPSERCVRRSARGRRRQRSGRGNFWHLLAFAG